ncbi:arfaptin-1-like isoform X1 [Cyprinus carpio]|uniref:Arfaptin-1-like isoform X1 n=1 Tax=Cyprinus carpio TaxID=7962 RepID=A0A9Q9VAR8_CYPCA|nr:arfaptin-1-like isoform X1 [Cyprinus carpio]
MSEASFDSGKNASQDTQSDPNEQGPQNTADSVSQSKGRKNSLDEAHMTEIDISEDKEVGNHNYAHSEDEDVGDEDGDSQAQCKTSGIIRDNADSETTSSVATEADVKVAMAEEAHRSQAAHISVTRNGEADMRSHEEVSHRDVPHNVSSGPIRSHSHNSPENYAVNEGVVQVGPYTGSPFQATTPKVVPSPAAASRLARSISDSQVETQKGALREQQMGGAVVLADDIKSPAIEKLELVRKWSINTYKCTKQILSEKLGRGSRTVDLELEAQIEILRDNKRKYEHVIKLAQTLCTQLAQMLQTQRQLGDAFADLSLKTPELHEEFGYNAETQKLLAKNGETLLGAINFFISNVKTLVDKTIEDTLINIKQYEAARIEYDAYRTDLEELNLGPRDANTLPKIELSQQQFQIQREKYEKMRNDVSVKLKFLEENKVKVLHNQLILFHNAIAAYFAGNQQQLEQTLKQFHIKLKLPGGETPSWLEEH